MDFGNGKAIIQKSSMVSSRYPSDEVDHPFPPEASVGGIGETVSNLVNLKPSSIVPSAVSSGCQSVASPAPFGTTIGCQISKMLLMHAQFINGLMETVAILNSPPAASTSSEKNCVVAKTPLKSHGDGTAMHVCKSGPSGVNRRGSYVPYSSTFLDTS